MTLIFDLIDMRSFSNLWYWIALAVTWSSTSHWVLGVPFDMVLRARRRGGEAARHLELMTQINTARMLNTGREAGVALMLIVSFLLTTLITLGFGYGIELAQALTLIVLPLTGVAMMSLGTARKIERDCGDCIGQAETIAAILTRHRVKVQILGLISISTSAFWGMLQNLQASILN